MCYTKDEARTCAEKEGHLVLVTQLFESAVVWCPHPDHDAGRLDEEPTCYCWDAAAGCHQCRGHQVWPGWQHLDSLELLPGEKHLQVLTTLSHMAIDRCCTSLWSCLKKGEHLQESTRTMWSIPNTSPSGASKHKIVPPARRWWRASSGDMDTWYTILVQMIPNERIGPSSSLSFRLPVVYTLPTGVVVL